MTRTLDNVLLRYVGYALLFLFFAYLLYVVRGALPVFAVAALIAYALEPVLQRLEMRGHSRRSAVVFVFLIFLLLFCLLLALLASAWQQVQALAQNSAVYQQGVLTAIEHGRERLDQLALPSDVKRSLDEGIGNYQTKVLQQLPMRLQDAITWVFGSIGYLLVFLVVLPVLTLWFMIEMNPLRARLLMLVPAAQQRDVTKIGREINELLGRYVRGQIIICSLFGALCTITFSLLQQVYGMNYALILGLLATFIYLVPYLGMMTIALSAGLTAYLTSSAPIPCTILAVGSCVVYNLILDYGVAPRVLGRGTGLHPLLVIFALLSGAQAGGILGMILAVPVVASLRVVAVHLFPQLSAPLPHDSPEADAPTEAAADEEMIMRAEAAEAHAEAAV